jgi:23S rRNA (cytidine1920-2'-O)/16S rRNA (cytidine1409-2'-O)-methyltransferase
MTSSRLDRVLVDRGFVASREIAQRRIRAGDVYVNGHVAVKPSERIELDDVVTVSGSGCPYVSRGGLKLEKALDCFGVSPRDKVVLDAGTSTGGFADCLLQRGARIVYALDVGNAQLAPELRADGRVRVMERRNLRDAVRDWFDPVPDMGTADLSFISLALVLPVFAQLLPDDGDLIALVKPQFEAGRSAVPKSGVVIKAETHRRVLAEIARVGSICGLTPVSVTYSPIRGGCGNIEFLVRFQRRVAPVPAEWDDLSARTVEEAHLMFSRDKRSHRPCIVKATSPR